MSEERTTKVIQQLGMLAGQNAVDKAYLVADNAMLKERITELEQLLAAPVEGQPDLTGFVEEVEVE